LLLLAVIFSEIGAANSSHSYIKLIKKDRYKEKLKINLEIVV
jgi:hypothetical protein